MATAKKKPQIHFSGIDRTGTKWTVTEYQKAAVVASSKILEGTAAPNKRKQSRP